MERLNDVYNDNNNDDDNTVIIRVLNTILENVEEDDSELILDNILYYVELFNDLLNDKKRDDIEYIVSNINYLQSNQSFDNFLKLLDSVIDNDMSHYKNIFILCYCRATWEILYNDNIGYTNPKYASMEAMTGEYWNVFIKAYKNNEFVYIKK